MMIKRNVKQALLDSIEVLPNPVYKVVKWGGTGFVDSSFFERYDIERYAEYLISNFDKEIDRIANNNKCLVIRTLDYKSEYFTITFAHNILNLIVYSMFKGYIPLIEVNEHDEGDINRWSWYFKSPSELYWKKYDINSFQKVECNITNSVFRATFRDVYHKKTRKIQTFLVNKFAVLKDDVQDYVNREINQLLVGNMLGVLCRGTDYVTAKPKGHPVQPSIDMIIEDTRRMVELYGYDKIYVASEEKKIVESFVKSFGKDVIVVNKRVYYDEFYSNKYFRVGDVAFNRDNDRYLKGLEYISSLHILSKCNALLAGNCGGSSFSLFLNDGAYKMVRIYKLGYYK